MNRKSKVARLAREYDLTVVGIRSGGHAVVTLRNSEGLTRKFTMSFSNSDWRAERNMRAQLKKFSEEKRTPANRG